MDAIARTIQGRKVEKMRDAFENKTETITFTVEEATMNKLREKFEDVNVNECPWFDVQDRHGNAARYYREDAQPKRIDDEEKKKRLLAEELRARKIMIEDFEGIIHDVIPEVDVYDAIEEVLGWRI